MYVIGTQRVITTPTNFTYLVDEITNVVGREIKQAFIVSFEVHWYNSVHFNILMLKH